MRARPVGQIAEALRFIRARPRVASLVTVKSGVGIGNGVLAAFPVLAATVFGMGAIATGLLFAARGLGVIVGPLLFRRLLERREWLLPGLAISMIAYGVAYLLAAPSAWLPSNATSTPVPSGPRVTASVRVTRVAERAVSGFTVAV